MEKVSIKKHDLITLLDNKKIYKIIIVSKYNYDICNVLFIQTPPEDKIWKTGLEIGLSTYLIRTSFVSSRKLTEFEKVLYL